MGFRNPVTTVSGLDTGGPGSRVRIIDTGSGGAVELISEHGTAILQAFSSMTGSAVSLVTAPTTDGNSSAVVLRDYDFDGPGVTVTSTGDIVLDAADGRAVKVSGDLDVWTGTRWKRAGLDPVSADRTVNINGFAIPRVSTLSPAGIGLTLPALPIGHVVVVELGTDFYAEDGAAQSLMGGMTALAFGATRIAGHGHSAVSSGVQLATCHTRQTWRIDVATPVSFASSYTTGDGTPRAVLRREDWTAWL
jgi:hypothetical protein